MPAKYPPYQFKENDEVEDDEVEDEELLLEIGAAIDEWEPELVSIGMSQGEVLQVLGCPSYIDRYWDYDFGLLDGFSMRLSWQWQENGSYTLSSIEKIRPPDWIKPEIRDLSLL